MRVGYYQFRPLFGQPQKNLNKVVRALSDVQADLVVLPELAFSGYFFGSREEALSLSEDPSDSRIVDGLIALCERENFYLIAGLAEKKSEKCFNSALLVGPQGVVHTYRKIHLFNEEKKWFDPGDTPLTVQEVRGAQIGIMICFDWIFPEVTRTLTVMGADVICHPSNLVLSYCQKAMLSRCLENNVFAVTANRFGADKRPHGELRFTGKSQIVAPKGELLHRSPAQRESIFIAEIDPQVARDKNITPLNQIMADRRPEFYKPLAEVRG